MDDRGRNDDVLLGGLKTATETIVVEEKIIAKITVIHEDLIMASLFITIQLRTI